MSYIHQQINLYQPIFRKQRILFSFVVSLQIATIFLLALILLYVVSMRGITSLDKQLQESKTLNQQRLSQLAKVSGELSKRNGDSTQSRVQQLKQELEAERFLLSVLGEVYASHRKGFSGYLEGFSRRVIDGLWITRFDMLNGGASVKLVGGALKPDAVPRFIENLKQEESLRGTKFQILEMDRASGKNWLNFSLASEGFSETPFDVKE